MPPTGVATSLIYPFPKRSPDPALGEQFDYIARDNFDAALRFLDAAEKAFEDLAQMPGMGRATEVENPRLVGLRQWTIRGFERHLIYYRETDQGIEVLRVLHGARDIRRILEEDPS